MTAANTPAEEIEARRVEWDAEPVCPNEDDDVLCAIQPDGLFVPECGCPVHDPDDLPPGPKAAAPFVRKPEWDAADNCTLDGCGHPRTEHGRYTGCMHAPTPGSLAFCFCPRRVWS